jgi:CDP-diacylglycerol--serine O-phosphatidyltransferase
MELMAEGESKVVLAPARRGMYVLPSLFTSGSIALGYYTVIQGIRGATAASAGASAAAFDHAALAVVVAIVCDGLDGRIARMTNTSSSFGKELDSLADVITFGVGPSLLAYLWGVRQVLPSIHPEIEARLMHAGLVVCFLFLICGACRLARFNITVDPKPHNPGRPGRKYFVGMPIPAGAGVIAAVIHFEGGSPIYNVWMSLIWLVLVLFVGFLMVSNWRFWSGKEIDMSARKPGRLLVFLVVVIGIIVEWHTTALLVLALGYMVSGVMARLAYSWKRRFTRAA